MQIRHAAIAPIAVAIGIVSTLAGAQVPTARTVQTVSPPSGPQLAAASLKLKPVAVTPQLQQALAQKAVFDPAKLQGKLTYVGAIPQLQVAGNKSVQLEPVGEAPPAYVPTEPALKAQLVKYQPHYSTRYVGKARPSMALQNIVDNKEWQTPIRDQGIRGTCVAFASMAGLEWMFKKSYSKTVDLSENHAYNVFMSRVGSTCMADPGIKTVDAATFLTAERVCDEAVSPYLNAKTTACAVIPPACTLAKRHGITIASKFFAPEYGGTGDDVATNTSFLEALVNTGLPVVMGVHMAGTDWSDGSAESGIVDVQKTSGGQPAASFGGHAMLLVGYNSTADYFIFKNSWGSGGGHNGYYHLSYEYLQTYAKYGYVIVATTAP